MIIEELDSGCGVESGEEEEQLCVAVGDHKSDSEGIIGWHTKRVLIGAGARALFYPTLFYNVVRNKIQAEFHWWDTVDEFLLLGAVPFPGDVPCLKELGVGGVVTLNEPYETLVPTSLYHDHGINHLVIPTRDYYFAPSLRDICQAVEFIHENALSRQTTYVHCKAGRGRSTTIVLCYLMQHRQMTPDAAYGYVKSIRPRVRLASAQWQAVQEYYKLKVQKSSNCINATDVVLRMLRPSPQQQLLTFDDGSVVVISEADLHGYDASLQKGSIGSAIWADLHVVYRVRVAGEAARTRISCLWLRCRMHQNILNKQLISRQLISRQSSCSIRAVAWKVSVWASMSIKPLNCT